MWNYFYPPDYKLLDVTGPLKPGDRRCSLNFKISAVLGDGADLDLLYSKKGGIGAMQIHSSEVLQFFFALPFWLNVSCYLKPLMFHCV